jgi:dihydroorotate dehydrogenase (NAD+) catalytic subunit
MSTALGTSLAGLRLKTPLIAASGTFGYGAELKGVADYSGIGAITAKTVTPEPRAGNAPPRVLETPSGMLNSIGLENPGAGTFIAEKLPELAKLGIPVIVSVAGKTEGEYGDMCAMMRGLPGIAAVEVNISCPNVKQGGQAFGADPWAAAAVTAACRKSWPGTLIVKLTPNVTDLVLVGKAVEGAGADALTAVNTFKGMAIDIGRRKPYLGGVTGGLSGPAIRPLAVRCVWELSGGVKVPIIASGGAATGADAIEFIMAGATAVSIGTATFIDPSAITRIAREIEAWMDGKGVKSIDELVGAARKREER